MSLAFFYRMNMVKSFYLFSHLLSSSLRIDAQTETGDRDRLAGWRPRPAASDWGAAWPSSRAATAVAACGGPDATASSGQRLRPPDPTHTGAAPAAAWPEWRGREHGGGGAARLAIGLEVGRGRERDQRPRNSAAWSSARRPRQTTNWAMARVEREGLGLDVGITAGQGRACGCSTGASWRGSGSRRR
jgi:hypothetical protein